MADRKLVDTLAEMLKRPTDAAMVATLDRLCKGEVRRCIPARAEDDDVVFEATRAALLAAEARAEAAEAEVARLAAEVDSAHATGVVHGHATAGADLRAERAKQHAAHRAVVVAEAQRDALAEALRRVEWKSKCCSQMACPSCEAHERDGHVPGCTLAAALAKVLP